jgi:hypothetical protein
MKTPYAISAGILFLLTISEMLNAQQSTFAEVFYENAQSFTNARAYSIIKSSDNHYMIVGGLDGAALLIKMDTNGTILWNKKYGSYFSDRFYGIVETDDSCFVIAGYHYFYLAGSHYPNWIQNILCVKVNSQGDTIWSRTIDNGFESYALSISQTNDGGYILAGFTYQTQPPWSIMIVNKLDHNGNLSWSRTLACGTENNKAFSIKQTPDSGYIVTGNFDNYPNPPYEYPAVMIKLTPTGNVSWAYKYSTGWWSWFGDAVVTWNGLLFLTFTDIGIVLMKTDFSGNVQWSKLGPYASGAGDEARPKLRRTSDNGYVMITSQQLMKIDSAGNFLWSQDLFLQSSDVIESSDKGLLAIGKDPEMGNDQKTGIIKTDSLGNSSACVMQSSVTTDTITCVLVPVSVTTTTAGTQADLPLSISNAGLTAYSGCDFTINVRETTRERNALLVYPNPSNGMIRIKTDQKSDGDLKLISIYDGTGKCIYQSSNRSSFHSPIDITTSPDGIYYIQVVYRDTVCSQVFTISH